MHLSFSINDHVLFVALVYTAHYLVGVIIVRFTVYFWEKLMGISEPLHF